MNKLINFFEAGIVAGIGTGIVAFVIFALVVLSTLLGGIAGWTVGLVFPYVTDTLRELSGVELSNFQIGATLGFVGSFFKSSSSVQPRQLNS